MTSSDLDRDDDGGIENFLIQEVQNYHQMTAAQQQESAEDNNKILTFGQGQQAQTVGLSRPPINLRKNDYLTDLRNKYTKELDQKRSPMPGQRRGSAILNRSFDRAMHHGVVSETQQNFGSNNGLPSFSDKVADRQFATADNFAHEPLSASQELNRAKKSVRFQVYNAKDMHTLRSMRQTMQDKFQKMQERSQSPVATRAEVLSQMRKQMIMSQSQSQMSGSLGFKPSDLAAAQKFNQLANSRKTPRPNFGQAPSDSEAGSLGQDKEIRTNDQLSNMSPYGNQTGTISNRSGDKSQKSSPLNVNRNSGRQTIHQKTISRDKQLRVEQGMRRLAESFGEMKLVRKSRTLIDSFDLIKFESDQVKQKVALCEQMRERNARKFAFKMLKCYLDYKRQKVLNVKRAQFFTKKRQFNILKQVKHKMQHVLRLEQLWLKEVRYQFAFSIREQAFSALKTHVKYRRVKYARKMKKYACLVKQLQRLVEDSRLRQAQAVVYEQRRKKQKMLKALQSYMQYSLIKKAKKVKASKLARRTLQARAMAEWLHQVAAMKRIRGDKLLWQAHSSNSEFFSVSIKVGAKMDYKQNRPVAQQRHFLIPQQSVIDGSAPDEDQVLQMRESVKIGLGNMIQISID